MTSSKSLKTKTKFSNSTTIVVDRMDWLGGWSGRKYSNQQAPATITSAWNITRLTGIAEGTDINDRIGREIVVDEIRFGGQLFGGQTNTALDDPYNNIRMLVVMAMSGLVAADWAAVTLEAPIDPRTTPKLQRLFYDTVVDLRVPGVDTVGYLPAHALWTRRVKCNVPIKFTSNAGASVNGYDLYACWISDSAAAPSPGFVQSFVATIFHDVNSR
jgi:hypothetical protein